MNFRFRQGGILITIIINTECYFTVYSDIFSLNSHSSCTAWSILVPKVYVRESEGQRISVNC